MRVRYTARAAQDLTGILEFLQSRNPASTAKVLAGIRTSVRLLGKHPFTGRAQAMGEVRKAGAAGTAHLIYYDVDEAQSLVSILAIQTPSRDQPYIDA